MTTGEWCTRIYLSFEQWRNLMENKPRNIGGGCKTPLRESANTCVTYGIDPAVANWLKSQGIKLQVIRESEIGNV